MNLYMCAYLIFIVGPLGIVVHEAGHIFAAKFIQTEKISLSIGIGKKIAEQTYKVVQIQLHLIYFIGARIQSERTKPYHKLEIIFVSICGPISNLLFGLLLYIIYFVHPNPYISLLLFYNCWLAVVNIIPFRIRGMQSDGYMIWKALFVKKI